MSTAHYICVFLLGLVIYYFFKWWNNELRRMPGPTPLPIIGNLHQVDLRVMHKILTDWQRKYGDVYRIKLFNEYVVVLNGNAVLGAKGADVAGRPTNARTDMILYNGAIFFRGYTPKLLYMRKSAIWALKSFGVGMRRLENTISLEVKDFCDELAAKNGQAFDPDLILTELFANIIATMIAGDRFTYKDRRAIRRFTELGTFLSHPTEHALFDKFPWLRYFGNKTYKLLQELEETQDQMMDSLFTKPKETMDPSNIRGISDALMVSQSEKHVDESERLSDLDIKAINANLIGAGASTSSSTMRGALLVLLNHPEIAKKLQKEVDEAVTDDRLPTLEDKPNMPYFEAFVLELNRYLTVAPLNARITETDTVIGGYNVPAGTQVLLNAWSVNQGEAFYENPTEFRPERFLTGNGNVVAPDHPARRNSPSFGVGRRLCIGENVAKTRLFLILAAILKKFDVCADADEPAPSCDPRTFEVTIQLVPKSFKVRFIERK